MQRKVNEFRRDQQVSSRRKVALLQVGIRDAVQDRSSEEEKPQWD
jgi:hypothetical protein